MTNIPDLTTVLCLDPKMSSSPFGGNHRTILISKDYTNSSDFAFNSLLHYHVRKDPNTSILLVTLAHEWTNYSASAAKCGYNLRRTQNKGNIEVLNVMSAFLNAVTSGDQTFSPCEYILKSVSSFIKDHTNTEIGGPIKPIIVMIDDISLLLSINSKNNEVYQLFSSIDRSLRDRSQKLSDNQLSHFIVQTMVKNYKPNDTYQDEECDINHIVANMENLSDISLSLKPLNTGYSTRVDGTIKIIDNRLPTLYPPASQQLPPITSLLVESAGEIGTKKAFFFKLGDRRVRLTSSALIL